MINLNSVYFTPDAVAGYLTTVSEIRAATIAVADEYGVEVGIICKDGSLVISAPVLRAGRVVAQTVFRVAAGDWLLMNALQTQRGGSC